MPVWTTKRFAAYGLLAGLAALNGGLQLACHHGSKDTDFTNPPQMSYQTTLILPTAGQLFTSVAPKVSAFTEVNGIGQTQTSGFSFTVTPPLPAGLQLVPGTGLITGTPAAASPQTSYAITASNAGGGVIFNVTLGVLASSPVTLDYAGTGAVSTAVGGFIALPLPAGAVQGGTPTGFGVTPALPAGLGLNPSTGLVSGSPIGALPTTTFTLTATTPQGSANGTFTLVVAAGETAPPLALAYAGGPFSPAAGAPFDSGQPTLTAPAADVVYTVSPPLPLASGLTLDCTTGEITGTPAGALTETYTVTASNAAGNSQVIVLMP